MESCACATGVWSRKDAARTASGIFRRFIATIIMRQHPMETNSAEFFSETAVPIAALQATYFTLECGSGARQPAEFADQCEVVRRMWPIVGLIQGNVRSA